jgi:hypothetical protein
VKNNLLSIIITAIVLWLISSGCSRDTDDISDIQSAYLQSILPQITKSIDKEGEFLMAVGNGLALEASIIDPAKTITDEAFKAIKVTDNVNPSDVSLGTTLDIINNTTRKATPIEIELCEAIVKKAQLHYNAYL